MRTRHILLANFMEVRRDWSSAAAELPHLSQAYDRWNAVNALNAVLIRTPIGRGRLFLLIAEMGVDLAFGWKRWLANRRTQL